MELNGSITAGGALYGAFGTDSGNYNDLRNKPSINGVELVGNKTSEDLLIEPGGTTNYEDLENKPQINYTPLEGNLTLDDLDIQSKIDFPEDSFRFLDGAGQFRVPDYFSGDYDDLDHRPEIAGITLTGNQSLNDLGIQEEINFPSDSTKYLDGEGNFTTPAYFSGDYDDLDNRPEIAGITLTGNQSLTDLGIQAEIDFPEDNTLYLDGNGNFTQPNYFSGDYDDLTDKPQINSVTLEGNKTASDLKLISEIHEDSGSSVIFEADDTLPLLSCITDIVATQDLHGYSKPWAGGAGKNKLEVTATSQYIYTVASDGEITADGTSNGYGLILGYITPDTTTEYKLNGCPTGGGDSTYRLDARLTSSPSSPIAGSQDTGNGATFTASEEFYIFLRSPNGAILDNVVFKPMVRISSVVDDTFEPYSNICPISGHTDVTVTVASTSGGSGDDTTVSLGRTVYGGTLDVTTGELTVDKADVNLSQQTLSYTKFTTGTSDRFYVRLSNYISNVMIDGFNDIESDYFDAKMQSTNEVGTIYMENGYLNMNMTMGQFADATAFKTWIESESVHLVYELATPQTYNITPEEISTLLGENEINSDTGDIEITYVTNVIDPLLKYLLENR